MTPPAQPPAATHHRESTFFIFPRKPLSAPDGWIEFTLETSSHVRIEVFDVSGRSVVTLADGVVAAGPHRYRWDSRGAPSGIYFYNVRGPDFLKSGKITVPAR